MDDSQRMGWAREGEGGRVRVGGGGTHREFVESWLESRVGTAARPAFLLLVLWVAHRHDTTRAPRAGSVSCGASAWWWWQ
jgi:hypothetical protein